MDVIGGPSVRKKVKTLSPRAVALQQAVKVGKIKGRELALAAYAGDDQAQSALGAKAPKRFDEPRKWVNGLRRRWGHLAFIHSASATVLMVNDHERKLQRIPEFLLHKFGNAAHAIGLATQVFERPMPSKMILNQERKLSASFLDAPATSHEAQLMYTVLLCAFHVVSDPCLAHEHCYEAVRNARCLVCKDELTWTVENCLVIKAVQQRLIGWSIGSVS